MNMYLTTYSAIRHRVRPADVVAFQGRGFVPTGIRIRTRPRFFSPRLAPVSHTGIAAHIEEESRRVLLHESTSLPGVVKVGVQPTYMSERVESYNGLMWWLPLSMETRKRLDLDAFWEFLELHKDRGYDVWQALFSALPFYNHEDFGKMFCSEHNAASLEAGGAIGDINASEVNPYDLVRFRLFSHSYYQILGDDAVEIPGYNTIDPEGFGLKRGDKKQ